MLRRDCEIRDEKMRLLLFIAASLLCVNSLAEIGRVTGLPIPRFVSFKAKSTNVRSGPSNQHPVKWVYHRKGYPVKVVAEFEHWRKINDIDGEDGWVHEAMLSGVRYVVVIKNVVGGIMAAKQPASELFLFRKASVDSPALARMQIGSVCALKECKVEWCKVNCQNHVGWVLKENVWGVGSSDVNMRYK